jgi:hypothetical protein
VATGELGLFYVVPLLSLPVAMLDGAVYWYTTDCGVETSLSSSSLIQQILRHLWNPEVYYRVHNSPPLDPLVGHFTLVFLFY